MQSDRSAAWTADDEAAVLALVSAFADTWNGHDMDAMHALDSDDVEWVNITGNHWRGRADVQRGHANIHRTIFASTGMSVETMSARSIASDVAVVVATMHFGPIVTPTGDEIADQKTRGSFTMVKRDAHWRIVHFHNTNVDPIAEQSDPLTWDESGLPSQLDC
jgi:uncharacterized protein (TIGR02246 family)